MVLNGFNQLGVGQSAALITNTHRDAWPILVNQIRNNEKEYMVSIGQSIISFIQSDSSVCVEFKHFNLLLIEWV
jgi:hypothetical protein